MADRGYVASLLKPLADSRLLTQVTDYILRNLRVGLPGHQKPAENLQWIQLDGVTHATALGTVAIAHGLSEAPRVAFPCLDLTTANKQMPVLFTARPADASYVYLGSPSTSASFTIFVESRA